MEVLRGAVETVFALSSSAGRAWGLGLGAWGSGSGLGRLSKTGTGEREREGEGEACFVLGGGSLVSSIAHHSASLRPRRTPGSALRTFRNTLASA